MVRFSHAVMLPHLFFSSKIPGVTSSQKSCSLDACAFLASRNQRMWRFKDEPGVNFLGLIGFGMSPSKAEGMRKCEREG